MRAAFFGLGAMGAPMAARLVATGMDVAPADADANALERWRSAHGGHAFGVAEASLVISCVTDEAALRGLAAGVIDRLQPGALWIDHTTTAPRTARSLAEACARVGAAFVDAPVSGGPDGAAAGRLVAMAGGTHPDIARAKPPLAAYTARVVHLGPPGSGQLAKLANQVAIAGTVRGLAEAVALARAGGIDVAALLDALAGGTAASRQLERTREDWVAGRSFEEAFAWLAKDLALALAEAEHPHVGLPMVARIAQLLDAQ